MWKNFAVLSLVATGITGIIYTPAQGATAIVADSQYVFYRASHSSLDQARAEALEYCVSKGGKNCTVVAANSNPGFGAVAESPSTYSATTGYATQEEANRIALNVCARQTPASETCRVTLQFFDGNGSRSTNPIGCINPATGLPMMSGQCWGVDIQGNPYGMKLR